MSKYNTDPQVRCAPASIAKRHVPAGAVSPTPFHWDNDLFIVENVLQ